MRKKTHLLHHPIRLGFVALVDCAPLIMAQELGLFEKYDVEVELHREVGGATIRDKVIHGELDAAANADWVIESLLSAGLVPDPSVLPRNGAQDWFRADLHRQALTLNSTTT
jgi:ABC-type nitrate/sulfonate/bicarbonate transport system substrate-binding protein